MIGRIALAGSLIKKGVDGRRRWVFLCRFTAVANQPQHLSNNTRISCLKRETSTSAQYWVLNEYQLLKSLRISKEGCFV